MDPVHATALAGTAAAQAHDVSMFALFLNADIIVKLVMFALLGASVWCWAIIFAKLVRLR